MPSDSELPSPESKHPVSDGPRIEITPTVAQYQQLTRDLAALRRAGAVNNTAAVIAAVHAAVERLDDS